jgi:hypothetical protein
MHHHRFIFAVEIQAAIEFQLQVKTFFGAFMASYSVSDHYW